MKDDIKSLGTGRVTLVLSIALGISLVMTTACALYATIFTTLGPAGILAVTQIMNAWGGGIIGIIGAYIGYTAKRKQGGTDDLES